jgi:hypothetical protein
MGKKTFKFQVGDRVGENFSEIENELTGNTRKGKLRFDPDQGPAFGKITNITATGMLVVEWDNDWRNHEQLYRKPQPATDFLPEKDVEAQLSKLEAEYMEVEKQVKAQLKEVAKGIRAANKLAKKTGRNLSEMFDAHDALYNAMDASGWQTSSYGC